MSLLQILYQKKAIAMKKTFNSAKIIISLLLLFSTLFLISAAGISALDTSEKSGITIKDTYRKVNGSIYTFSEGYYYTDQPFENIPRTFEAWVKIPKSFYNTDCGVIFGNYAGYDKDVYINYEILKGGVPRFLYSVGNGEKHDFCFDEATVEPDKWTHIAIVYGAGSTLNNIHCYINGELRQSFGADKWSLIPKAFYENKFSLAGDGRSLNKNHFKGELGDVVMYSDVRNAELIKADMTAPDTDNGAMIAYYQLFGASSKQDIPDKSGNGFHMYYSDTWTSEKEMMEFRSQDGANYAYSIAFIPDTQYMTRSYPENLSTMYDWLINNAQKRNIQYVVSVGDMTNDNKDEEWQTVKAQTDRMNGIIPYTVLRGNHDTIPNDGAENFDKYYAQKDGYYYNHVKENGGFYDEDSVKNTYLLFSVGKVDYMLLNLDFGADNDVLVWANSVLSEYPDRRVIVVTHAYLSFDGTTLKKGGNGAPSHYKSPVGVEFNDGDFIWDELIWRHENVSMVVCGHMHSDSIVVSKAYGMSKNTVYQMLIDAQTSDSVLGGLGLVGMMYFTEDGEFAAIEYYSTVWNSYFYNRSSRTTFNFPPVEEEAIPEQPAADKKADNNNVLIISVVSGSAVAVVICGICALVVCKKKRAKRSRV